MFRQMPRQRITPTLLLLAAFLAPAPTLRADADAPTRHPAVKAWLEVWNTGADNFDSFLTEDVSYADPFYSKSGRQGYRDIVATAMAAFRDIEFTADDLILDDDRGALKWTATATHIPSGKAVSLQGVSVLRFEGGKIAEEWRVYDGAALTQQIGPDGSDGGGGDSGDGGGGDGNTASEGG